MPVILVEGSLHCTMNCVYCYNTPLRKETPPTDLNRIRKAIEALAESGFTGPVILHGGEPLDWPINYLTEIFSAVSSLGLRPAIQTNLLHLRDEHLELFQRYGVHVGVSCDGPGDLNRFRTDPQNTSQVLANLERLRAISMPVSIIIVLSKANAVGPSLEQLKDFVRWCTDQGIYGRLNPCIHPSPQISLDTAEVKNAYLELARLVLSMGVEMRWSPFRDIVNALRGKQEVVCGFRPCFPLGSAVIVVTPTGDLGVCHKFHEHVILHTLRHCSIREEVLAQTDCKGCEYFGWACWGGCPAHARDGDWRNKDRFCPAWKALFRFFQDRIQSYEDVGSPTLCRARVEEGR